MSRPPLGQGWFRVERRKDETKAGGRDGKGAEGVRTPLRTYPYTYPGNVHFCIKQARTRARTRRW